MWKNGRVKMIITINAKAAKIAGRRPRIRVQRAHSGDSSSVVSSPARTARRSRRRGTRPPTAPNSAGSSVSAAITVNATTTAAATATPYRKLTPSANIPSIAITTIIPANSTARPEVSIASTTASSRLTPRRVACRKRVTMNSA